MAGVGEFRDPPPPSRPPAGTPPRPHPRPVRGAAGGEELAASPPAAGRTVVTAVPPADVSPIPGARDFFRILRYQNIAPGATINPPELQFQVALADYAALQFFSIFCDATTIATNVVWTLRRGRAPVPGFEAITFSPRATSSFERTFPCDVKCQTGTLVTVSITNNGAAAEKVGCTFGGWTWNRLSGERYTGLPFLTVR